MSTHDKSLELGVDPCLGQVFYESYNMDSDDSDEFDGEVDMGMIEADDESANDMVDNEEGTNVELKLGISKSQADKNYFAAGTEVEEEEDAIKLSDYCDLVDHEIDGYLEKIVNDLELPYKLRDFQRLAIHTICSLKNLILVSPTGSGKMDVPLLSALVLRERLGIKKGVAIITQPLTAIMHQKLNNKICQVAVLSMTGQLNTSDTNDDADLSCAVSDILDGKNPVLLGHPESFDSPTGQHILRELQRHDRLLMVCIDEFHQGGQGHWSSFRPEMMKMSTGLRLYGIQNCPSVCMTATATNDEIKEVVRALGVRTPPVILAATPVQSHIKIRKAFQLKRYFHQNMKFSPKCEIFINNVRFSSICEIFTKGEIFTIVLY